MGESSKIFTVSLESTQRHKAYAIYDGERLAITHCKPISGQPSIWKDDLVKEILDKSENGFVVMSLVQPGKYALAMMGPAGPILLINADETAEQTLHREGKRNV